MKQVSVVRFKDTPKFECVSRYQFIKLEIINVSNQRNYVPKYYSGTLIAVLG